MIVDGWLDFCFTWLSVRLRKDISLRLLRQRRRLAQPLKGRIVPEALNRPTRRQLVSRDEARGQNSRRNARLIAAEIVRTDTDRPLTDELEPIHFRSRRKNVAVILLKQLQHRVQTRRRPSPRLKIRLQIRRINILGVLTDRPREPPLQLLKDIDARLALRQSRIRLDKVARQNTAVALHRAVKAVSRRRSTHTVAVRYRLKGRHLRKSSHRTYTVQRRRPSRFRGKSDGFNSRCQ